MTKEAKRKSDGTFASGNKGNPYGRAGKPKSDGWGGALTGIGNATSDKRMSHDFQPPVLSYQQLLDIAEGDDLGERAVKAPIDDAFRPGFEISIEDEGEFNDLKNDILKRMRELGVVKVVKKALYQKRALGGSAILLGTNDYKTLSTPLDRKNAKGIEYLTVLEPMMLQPYLMYENPAEPKYGEVKVWQLMPQTTYGSGMVSAPGQAPKVGATEKQAQSQYIHESRLIILNAERLSAYSVNHSPAGQYWGLSILVKLYDVLRDFNISWAAAGLLVTDFSQGVFSMQNLMQLIMRDENKLIARMRALDLGRSVAKAIVIDKEGEAFQRQTTNVAGLPDLLVQLSRRLAAAIDIPLSVLMGGGEKSADAEMGNELRYYYDKCSSVQTEEAQPILQVIIEFIIRGLRERKIPKNWSIKWHPLWQLTDEQKANARLAQARVDAIYIEHGVLDPQTVAMVRFGGEYSYDTPLGGSYEAPGFMALPPMGVLVDGLDPNTGLPPGEVPDTQNAGKGAKTGQNKKSGAGQTGAHGVKGYSRRNPTRKNMAKSNYSQAGGVTAGNLDQADDFSSSSGDPAESAAVWGAVADRPGEDEHCTTEHETHTEMELCTHCSKCMDCMGYTLAKKYVEAMRKASDEIAAQIGEEPLGDIGVSE